jgi:hypothetical protein
VVLLPCQRRAEEAQRLRARQAPQH